ncbi:sensor histidine kinase [Kaistia terrae]|uniref:histidine kinase n=1 Tax=Kaistia terrae TaxID=537017 RepID=A0ABW0PXJ2_9HYPH|nr:PAS domain-containing sensor histidine kinase [Kaistia terrae]MCX5580760.1 PAS domain-containing protein [Kaistia terrae]
MNALKNVADAQTLAQAIVNTIPEPFLVLDENFSVLAASRSFYKTFGAEPHLTLGSTFYALGNGEWDIPALRLLLETIITEQTEMNDFEVEHDFPGLGWRVMLLNARRVLYDDSPATTILMAFRDITVTRALDREKAALLARAEELLQQKDVLLQEMRHRVANSLQIIASILMLKAKAVTSEETRFHLQDARQRVLSVAAVQMHLHASDGIDRIEFSTYLSTLCSSLGESMIGESQPIEIRVIAQAGTVESARAVSLGLIITELVINAIKYAFPVRRTSALILVTYEIDGADWRLTVSDNGVGKPPGDQPAAANGGLGTIIVQALVSQLDAQLKIENSPTGVSVSITRATFTSTMPKAT